MCVVPGLSVAAFRRWGCSPVGVGCRWDCSCWNICCGSGWGAWEYTGAFGQSR
jgi:hypothetical protein